MDKEKRFLGIEPSKIEALKSVVTALESQYGVKLDNYDIRNLADGQRQYDCLLGGPLVEVMQKIDNKLTDRGRGSRPAQGALGLLHTERELEIAEVMEKLLVGAGLLTIPPPSPPPSLSYRADW